MLKLPKKPFAELFVEVQRLGLPIKPFKREFPPNTYEIRGVTRNSPFLSFRVTPRNFPKPISILPFMFTRSHIHCELKKKN